MGAAGVGWNEIRLEDTQRKVAWGTRPVRREEVGVGWRGMPAAPQSEPIFEYYYTCD